MFSVVSHSATLPFSPERLSILNRVYVRCNVGNHTNTERPWLSSFAPRLRDELNRLAKEEKGENGEVEYEVLVSEEDREPLEVV